jgi:hypothetical protein
MINESVSIILSKLAIVVLLFSVTPQPIQAFDKELIENIRIINLGRANKGYAHLPLHRLDNVPENEAGYPEFHMFGELPSWGSYVRHVDGLGDAKCCTNRKGL